MNDDVTQSKKQKENRLNNWVCLTFRVGIAASLALVVIGLAMVISLSGAKDVKLLVPLNQMPAATVITLGILLLLLTPVLQVIVALATFTINRDKLYIGISTIVLCLLIFSLVLALI